jgi:hypothetical protein
MKKDYNDLQGNDPPAITGRTSFDYKRIHCEVGRREWTQVNAELAHIWNWGNDTLDLPYANTPKAIARKFKALSPPWWNLLIIQSLINDLHFALYGTRFQDIEPDSLFLRLRACANDFLNLVILRLDSQHLFETGRPISHVFVDIIACLFFLREKAGMKDDKSSIIDQVYEIVALREWFWHIKFSKKNLTNLDPQASNSRLHTLTWLTENWDKYSKNISHQVNHIFRELRNLLLLDPNRDFMLVDPDRGSEGIPYFRAWDGNQRLRHHPLKQSAVPPTFRGDLYTSAGIRPGELNLKEKAMVNLSDFRASILLKGAFRIALTNDPSLHLQFDENNYMRPTLLILDSRTLSILALLDLTGLMA